MLYTLKSAGKKYAYDSSSGAVIQLNALQFKMLGAIVPPLTPVCPTSLRYELAKFDSMDVAEAYGQIYEQVWNEAAYGSENAVAVHIRHLREKLEINPSEPRYLKVVWGLGYKLEDPKQ